MHKEAINMRVYAFQKTGLTTYEDDLALVHVHGIYTRAEHPDDLEAVRLQVSVYTLSCLHCEPDDWISKVLPLQMSGFRMEVIVCA